MPDDGKVRVCWGRVSPQMAAYHDREWGVPQRDDRALFEFLILEGAQAGLSWETILRKRERYRAVFAGFDAQRVARFTRRDVARLLKDEGIVRNRLKIEAAITNAKRVLETRDECGGFSAFMWEFVNHAPLQGRRRRISDIPAATPESDALSRALRKRGFKFVGTTICYAFMQAVGMVNDHLSSCPRRAACAALA